MSLSLVLTLTKVGWPQAAREQTQDDGILGSQARMGMTLPGSFLPSLLSPSSADCWEQSEWT